MFVFPSKEWCVEAVRLVNEDPEIALAGEGWRGDFAAVIEAEPGRLAEVFVAHVIPEEGRIVEFTVLEDPDDLEELEPAYLIRGPYSVWKALMIGELDPVEAILKRRIAVQGNLQPLIERMRYKSIADRVFARIATRWADE